MVTYWIEDPAVTSSPGSMATTTTVPPIGATIEACETAWAATATWTSAASTARW